MKKVSETGIEKYTEEIGTEGMVMNIRVETSADGKKVSAPIVKGENEKKIGSLISEVDGSIFLSIDKNANLAPEEHFDLFAKAASVMAEIRGIEKPE